MARQLRIEYPGALYHVTSRGNARNDIVTDDDDRKNFLSVLGGVVKRFNWLCHAYCLMDNHYHLLIETPDGNLAKGMRQLNGVYTQRFNKRHAMVGHIFQGRYKAIIVEKESYLLELARYIVLNPVRARMVKSPATWKWSSYAATAGLCGATDLLTKSWILSQFGSAEKAAQKCYKEFIVDGVGDDPPWQGIVGQIFLGSEEFVEKLENLLVDLKEIEEIPKAQRHASRPTLQALFAGEHKLSKAEKEHKMYEAYAAYGYTLKEIADYFNIHYATVSRIISRTEHKSSFARLDP